MSFNILIELKMKLGSEGKGVLINALLTPYGTHDGAVEASIEATC